MSMFLTAAIDFSLLPWEFGLLSVGVESGSCELLSWAFTSTRGETEKTREYEGKREKEKGNE